MIWRFSSVAVLIGLTGLSLFFLEDLWVVVDKIIKYTQPIIWSATEKHPLLYYLILLVILILCLPVVSLALVLVIIFATMLVFGLLVYTAARFILIVLAFMQLRSLPPSSLNNVQWTTYMPHI